MDDKNTVGASEARKVLLAQHDGIREVLGRCRLLGHRLGNAEPVLQQLDLALQQLRAELAEHNMAETILIRNVLRGSASWGALLVDRMLEEHIGEHTVFWQLLSGTADDVAAHMDDLVEELEAHMAAEERTFLSTGVLTEDAIRRHHD